MNALDVPRAMARIAQLENENGCLKQETNDLKEQIQKAEEAYQRVKNELDYLTNHLEYRILAEQNLRLRLRLLECRALVSQGQLVVEHSGEGRVDQLPSDEGDELALELQSMNLDFATQESR